MRFFRDLLDRWRTLVTQPWVGPLVPWEWMRLCRRGANVRLRMLLSTSLFVALAIIYGNHFPQAELFTLSDRSRVQSQDMARFTEGYLAAFMFIELTLVIFMTPLIIIGGVTDEIQRRTMEYLFVTELNNREILLGKTLARLAQVFSMTIVGIPILAVMQFWAGVDLPLIFNAFLVVFGTMLSLAGLSLYAAVEERKLWPALKRVGRQVLTIGLVTTCCGSCFPYLSLGSPYLFLTQVLHPEMTRYTVDMPSWGGWLFLGVHGLVGFYFTMAAVGALRAPPRRVRRRIPAWVGSGHFQDAVDRGDDLYAGMVERRLSDRAARTVMEEQGKITAPGSPPTPALPKTRKKLVYRREDLVDSPDDRAWPSAPKPLSPASPNEEPSTPYEVVEVPEEPVQQAETEKPFAQWVAQARFPVDGDPASADDEVTEADVVDDRFPAPPEKNPKNVQRTRKRRKSNYWYGHVGDEPLYWKETYRYEIYSLDGLSGFDRVRFVMSFLFVIVLAAILPFWGATGNGAEIRESYNGIFVFVGGIMMLFSVVGLGMTTINAFALERQQQTLETLFTVPVERREILMSKAYGALYSQRLVGYYPFLVLLLLAVLSTGVDLFFAPVVLLYVASYSLFSAALGMFYGLRCKTLVRAQILLMITLFLSGFLPVLVAGAVEMAGRSIDAYWSLPREVADKLSVLNPVEVWIELTRIHSVRLPHATFFMGLSVSGVLLLIAAGLWVACRRMVDRDPDAILRK